jgi:hypothetical protein
VPLKGKLIGDQKMIAGSFLILFIFQKEEMAQIDAKAKMEKVLLTFSVSSIQKDQKFK